MTLSESAREVIMRLIDRHCDKGDHFDGKLAYSTGPVSANVKAVRLLVMEGHAEVLRETTQRLVFRLIWPKECCHGVTLNHNCNSCSDSGDDPRQVTPARAGAEFAPTFCNGDVRWNGRKGGR